MATERDICEEALTIINVIADGDSMPAHMFERCKISYAALDRRLRTNLKIRWNKDAVPDEYEEYVSGMLAGRLIRRFPTANAERGQAAAIFGEAELRKELAKHPRKTVQVSYI